jgi:hypothetical protein
MQSLATATVPWGSWVWNASRTALAPLRSQERCWQTRMQQRFGNDDEELVTLRRFKEIQNSKFKIQNGRCEMLNGMNVGLRLNKGCAVSEA